MSVYTRPDSSKSMLCACGGDSTRLPVGAIGLPKLSAPVCVPLAREKNHTRLGSNGSTWNQLLSARSGKASFTLKLPKALRNSRFPSGPTIGATNWKSSASSSSGLEPVSVPNCSK